MDLLTQYNFDYLEVLFCRDGVYDMSEERFNALLSKMKRIHSKCFQVDLKEYIHRNLRMIKKITENNEVEETKVYQISCMEVKDDPHNNYRVISSSRKKLSPVAFPSSMSYDDIQKKRRTVFRINNKIYVNFDKEVSLKLGDNTPRQKVFINFNNNKDTDIKDSLNVIKQLIESIC